MARPTITTLAESLGVSKMTISRVINNQPGVSEELRQRIQEKIDELGYVPSAQARSLATGKSNLIGVIVPAIVSEWITPLLLGVSEEAGRHGYQMLVISTGVSLNSAHSSPAWAAGSDLADGLIVASWRVPLAAVQKMVKHGTPVVVVDGFTRSNKISWVSAGDREGVVDAVRHLAGLGHRRIAFIGGGEEAYLAKQRLAGFQDGMRQAQIPLDESLLVHSDFTVETGYQRAMQLLGQPRPPTAILAASDPVALGVSQAAHELGIHIPEDLSVVGFDDTLAAACAPPLTTVQRDYTAMGRAAMNLLNEQLSGRLKEGTVTQMDLPTRLVIRKSTAPLKSSTDTGIIP